MTVYDYNGWIEITDNSGTPDTYKVLCENQPSLSMEDPSAAFMDYADDGHSGWTLDTRRRIVSFKNIWFETEANKDAFIAFLDGHQDDSFDLKIKTTVAGAYWKWDGTNTIMPVMWEKPRGIKKKFGGDTTIWVIGQITFRQCAALEA